MKTILRFGVPLFITIFLSCRKENGSIDPLHSSGFKPETGVEQVRKVDGRLHFSDREGFEAYMLGLNQRPAGIPEERFLHLKEEALGFQSYRTSNKQPGARRNGQDCLIEDEHLASVLNPDGVIQIGSWIMKVNLCEQKVFVLNQNEATPELLDRMAQRVPQHEKIRFYSTDQEVLDLLEAGVPGNRTARICFSESGAPEKGADATGFFTGDTRMDCKLRYQKAGI
ncbi:hypothetical protein [Larkinella soli]|uniref:hypothetical protein n=1 Tax=Larkinella soli TaxID=1770527 RepID=UPI000FFC1720|nr:hypothetical protein [Larkinella soli]